MATEHDQPPREEKSRKSRKSPNRTSGTRRTSSDQARSRPSRPQPEPESKSEPQEQREQPLDLLPRQAAPIGEGLGQLIQQQIAEAIRPVLADFRQQVAQAVEQRNPDTDGKGVQQEVQEVLASRVPHALTSQPQPLAPQPGEQTEAQPSQQPSASAEQQSERAPEQGGLRGTLGGVQGRVKGTVSPALNGALGFVEHQGEQWLRSLLLAGLDALLSESMHAAAQHRAEQGLHALLQKTFEALPDSTTSEELRTQTERTLQVILREAIDAVFAERVRKEVELRGAEVTQELAHRHLDSALDHAQQALRVLAHELMAVLRRQWQRVLRLLLRLILTALEGSLAPGEKESLGGVSPQEGEEAT